MSVVLDRAHGIERMALDRGLRVEFTDHGVCPESSHHMSASVVVWGPDRHVLQVLVQPSSRGSRFSAHVFTEHPAHPFSQILASDSKWERVRVQDMVAVLDGFVRD